MLQSLEKGDSVQLGLVLKQYKHQNGATNYLEVLKIPIQDRLVGLTAKLGYENVHKLMGAAILVAMENMNLSKPITAKQIFELVDTILDSATEDQLALEDVILFLQKLVRGQAGETYSKMDVPTFMKLFEDHRQKRYEELRNFQDEKDVYYKSLGKDSRKVNIERDSNLDPSTFFDLLQTFNEQKHDEMG